VIEAFMRHEDDFQSISITQKDVSDEDCISGLQRLADSVEALQRESTDLLNSETGIAAAKSQELA